MIELLQSKISLNIKGKNINRFIKKLRNNKIEILKIKYKNKNEANIIIYKKDQDKVKKIKSIYDITELEVFGLLKIEQNINKNKHLILIIIFTYILFIIMTKMIFKIEIIHSNKDIRNLLREELKKEGIKKYALKKEYKEVNKIKQKILNKYKDKIEWLEIESTGTKITVRVEERKIPNKKIEETPRNIIAKKKGVIKKVIAKKGDIVKDMDDYVEKGELIITGDLIFNNESKGKVRADGEVYAEIWYITKTKYPIVTEKEKLTGRKKNIYAIKFLSKTFELTPNKYKTKKIKEKTILKHNFLPIKLSKQTQRETKKISEILTYDEALEKAKEASVKYIKNKLNKKEYIIRSNHLKSNLNNSTIEVEMFFAVYENITDYAEIGWFVLIRQSLLEILGEVWPTILISSVIIISMRITYIIKNEQKFILYKELLSFVFVIYVLCLFYVVTFQDVGWSRSNFIPFKEMFRYSIGSRLFIKNVIGNIIMFIPYGFFVSYFLDLRKTKSMTLMALLVSISIEITQLVIGRVFDIDDIILNTIGGIIGFYLYKSLDFINDHLPNILKNQIVYNILIIIFVILSLLYMFNLIQLGV